MMTALLLYVRSLCVKLSLFPTSPLSFKPLPRLRGVLNLPVALARSARPSAHKTRSCFALFPRWPRTSRAVARADRRRCRTDGRRGSKSSRSMGKQRSQVGSAHTAFVSHIVVGHLSFASVRDGLPSLVITPFSYAAQDETGFATWVV